MKLHGKTIEGSIALSADNRETMGQVEICGTDLAKVGIKPVVVVVAPFGKHNMR